MKGMGTARRAGSRVLGVAVVYGTAVVALFLGELAFAGNASLNEFGEYNLVRQAVPLVAIVALIGYDQALTREVAADGGRLPRLDVRHFRIMAAAFLAGSFVALYPWARLDVSVPVALTAPVAATGVAASSLVSGLLRASGSSLGGAAVQQGHRLLTGLLLIVSGIATALVATWTLALAAVTVGAVGLALLRRRTGNADPITDSAHRHLRFLGIGYSLSMLSLAAGDWLDAVLIAELGGGTALVGLYAQLKLVTIYPLLSIGSVLGFLALPMIAARRDTLTVSIARRWLLGGAVGALVLGVALAPASRFAMENLLDHRPDARVVVTLAMVGALRLFYVLPSAMLGAVAPARLLSTFGGLTFLGLAVQAATTVLLRDQGLLLAASLGLLASTLLRTLLSSTMTLQELARRPATSAPDLVGT
jgi:hypothetical protein